MSTPTLTLFDLALRDVMTARGITATGMCRATGNHLASANDEPEFSEADLIAADKQRNADKGKAIQARDEDALLEQVQRMRIEGAL